MFTVSSNKQTLSGCGCAQPIPTIQGLGSVTSPEQVEANQYCLDAFGRSGNDIAVGQCNVYYTSNKHANTSFPGSKWNPVRWAGFMLHQSYNYDDVVKVIDTYISSAKQGICPEYGRPNDTSRAKSNEVIKKLKTFLPQYEENFIRVVMYELEQDVKGGIVAPTLLYPASIKDLNNVPSELKDITNQFVEQVRKDEAERTQPDFFDKVGTTLKYGLIAGGVVMLGWGAVKVYQATH